MDPIDLEVIYARVDDQLTERAKAEFVADPETLVDHREADWTCGLCGHKNCRWEFRLRNDAGGRDHFTGSTCVIQYGLRVAGSATASEALALLNGAISAAQRRATRDAWRAAHPDHATRVALGRSLFRDTPPRPRDYAGLKPRWRQRYKAISAKYRAMLKFYNRHGYLTDSKTIDLYGPEGAVAQLQAMATEHSRAAGPPGLPRPPALPGSIEARWAQFLAANPIMSPYERDRVNRMRRYNDDPDTPRYPWQKDILNGIRANNTPLPTSSVDNSDLPF
jgi:hypothetical protein